MTTTLRRQGECNGCGYCCQYEGPLRVTQTAQPDQSFDARYYEVRGYQVDRKKRTATVIMHAALLCPQYEYAEDPADDNVNGRCKIWAVRPQLCKDFPTSPEQIEGAGNCSYWFEVIEDGKVVDIRGGPGSPYPTEPRLRR